MTDPSTDAARRQALLHYLANEGVDRAASHSLYHEDAILEFPQSGERFFGRDTFRAWREQYPDPTEFRLRRLMGGGDHWWAELVVTNEGRPPMFGIGLYEFRGERVAREIVYVAERWDAPSWRSPWNTPFDRLASVAPADVREGVPFGLEAELVSTREAAASA
jgi:hypothetical protein